MCQNRLKVKYVSCTRLMSFFDITLNMKSSKETIQIKFSFFFYICWSILTISWFTPLFKLDLISDSFEK